MHSRLTHLQKRVSELDELGRYVCELASELAEGKPVQREIALKGEEWYRGSRSFLETQHFSGLAAFDACYESYFMESGTMTRALWDIGSYIHYPLSNPMHFKSMLSGFFNMFSKARALLLSCISELESREIPIRTELSFAVSIDEFETAANLLAASGEETIVRASGVVARVALERHLLTVAEARGVTIEKNPPHKSRSDVSDIINTLAKYSVLTPIQKSELEAQFKIGNNCAHPKESVKKEDVQNLIRKGRELASAIM